MYEHRKKKSYTSLGLIHAFCFFMMFSVICRVWISVQGLCIFSSSPASLSFIAQGKSHSRVPVCECVFACLCVNPEFCLSPAFSDALHHFRPLSSEKFPCRTDLLASKRWIKPSLTLHLAADGFQIWHHLWVLPHSFIYLFIYLKKKWVWNRLLW